MKLRTNQVLYSYWHEVRKDRIAPRRFDIEPARIASILSETMILEHVGPTAYRFRLAGTRIVDHFGVELRGEDFGTLWTPPDRAIVIMLLDQLARSGGCGVLTFEAEYETGTVLPFEAVLLPLIHTRNTIDRFLGAISSDSSQSHRTRGRLEEIRLQDWQIFDGELPYLSNPVSRVHELTDQGPADIAVFDALADQGRIVRSDRRQFRVLDGGLSTRDPSRT